MSKLVKNLVVEELKNRYGELDSAAVVRIIGLNAVSNNNLRRRLHNKKIDVHVVKNSLARVALKGRPLEPLAASLDGPVAMVTGGESIIDVAKELLAISLEKEYAKIELKFGIIEGDKDLVSVERIAQMKGRSQMQGDVLGCAIGPARKLVGCFAGPAGRVVGCLKTIADREEAEAPVEEVAAPAA